MVTVSATDLIFGILSDATDDVYVTRIVTGVSTPVSCCVSKTIFNSHGGEVKDKILSSIYIEDADHLSLVV